MTELPDGEIQLDDHNQQRVRARVIGCLQPGHVSVLVGFGCGQLDGGIPTEIPIDLVPFDLRMPNSDFFLVLDRGASRYVAVERIFD